MRFSVALPGEEPILEVTGTVTWKEGDTIGIAFDRRGRLLSLEHLEGAF